MLEIQYYFQKNSRHLFQSTWRINDIQKKEIKNTHAIKPDLAPCDFFLFPRMKGQMKVKLFADVSEVKKKTLEVLNNNKTDESQKCLQQWGKKLVQA